MKELYLISCFTCHFLKNDNVIRDKYYNVFLDYPYDNSSCMLKKVNIGLKTEKHIY